jgi:L-lysine exporter family protein LysE/ArgO
VVCALSDAVLILAGVTGIGLALQAVPWLIDAARWLGAAFLLAYGIMAARRAWRPTGNALETMAPATDAPAGSTDGPAGSSTDASAGTSAVALRTGVGAATALAPTLLTCLALTWLNPHVYLDTVFLLGSIAATHGDGRWLFAFGAILASFAWFFSLGFGARYLGRWLNTPLSWRVLDAAIAVVMIVLGISLVVPVLS